MRYYISAKNSNKKMLYLNVFPNANEVLNISYPLDSDSIWDKIKLGVIAQASTEDLYYVIPTRILTPLISDLEKKMKREKQLTHYIFSYVFSLEADKDQMKLFDAGSNFLASIPVDAKVYKRAVACDHPRFKSLIGRSAGDETSVLLFINRVQNLPLAEASDFVTYLEKLLGRRYLSIIENKMIPSEGFIVKNPTITDPKLVEVDPLYIDSEEESTQIVPSSKVKRKVPDTQFILLLGDEKIITVTEAMLQSSLKYGVLNAEEKMMSQYDCIFPDAVLKAMNEAYEKAKVAGPDGMVLINVPFAIAVNFNELNFKNVMKICSVNEESLAIYTITKKQYELFDKHLPVRYSHCFAFEELANDKICLMLLLHEIRNLPYSSLSAVNNLARFHLGSALYTLINEKEMQAVEDAQSSKIFPMAPVAVSEICFHPFFKNNSTLRNISHVNEKQTPVFQMLKI